MKKVLSLILAIVMLVAMLPASIATAVPDPFEHEYVLSQAAFNTGKMILDSSLTEAGENFGNTPVLRSANNAMYFTAMFDWNYEVPAEYSNTDPQAAFQAMDLTKTDKWAFVASRNRGAGTHVLPGGLYYEALRQYIEAGEAQYAVFRLEVEAAGQYQLQFRGSGSQIYPAVYFFKDGQTGVINSAADTYPAGSLVGHVNPNTPSYTTAGTVTVGEAGSYILAFQFDASSAELSELATQGINLAGIKLTPVVIDEITAIEASVSEAEIVIGNTATVSVKEVWTASGKVDADPSGITFESLNESVATVSDAGIITAVAEGSTSIKVTCNEDPTIFDTVGITVVGAPTARVYEYIFSQAGFNTDKMITTADYNGKPVIREANSAMYFKAMFDWNYEVAAEYSKDGNAFKALDTTEADGDAKLSDKWALVHSRDINATAHILPSAFKFEAPLASINDTATSPYAVFRINVDAPGYYALSLRGVATTSVYPAVYFFKEGTEGVTSTNTESYLANSKLGYFDANAADYVNIAALDITEAGDYILAFVFDNHSKELNSDTAYQQLFLSGAKLTPSQRDELTALEISTNKTSVAVGKTAKISATTEWTVSGKKDESIENVTLSSSDNNIATVDETGIVTGVAEGTVTITATLKADNTKTDTVEINVIVPPAARAHEYVFSQAGFNTDKMITTADYNGKPVIREANSAMYLKEMFDWNYKVEAEYSKDGEAFMALDTTADDGDAALTDKWKFVYSRDIMASAHILPSAFKFEAPLSHINDSANSPYAVFKLKVEAPGDYILQLRGVATTSVYPAVYFFADGQDGVTSTNKDSYPEGSKLGYFNTNNAEYAGLGKVTAPEAGDYILAFFFDNHSKELNSTTESQHLLLSGAKLIPESENVIESFVVLADKDQIMVGKTAKVTANMVWSALGNVAVDPSEVTFASSDETIATVDENGTVTAVSGGTATITATLKADANVSDSVDITVLQPEEPRINEYVISYAGMNSDKMITDANLTEDGDNFGNTPVIRTANNATYFMTMLDWNYEVPAKYSKDGSPFMALDTTVDDGDGKLTDKWAHVANRQGTGLSSMFIDAGAFKAQFRPSDYGTVTNYVAFRIYTDAPGDYILQARAVASSSGAAPATYFFKEGTPGVAINNPATYPAGAKLEYFNSSKNSDYNFVGNVKVDEIGSYIVVFATDEESAKINPATDNMGIPFQWFNLSGLRLVPQNLDFCKKLAVEAETDIIYIGETLKLDIFEVWEYAGNKEISPSEIDIEVSGTCVDVSADGIVSAISEGEAVITVTKKDNPELKGEFKVDVFDPNAENIGKRLEYVIGTKVMKDQTTYNPHNNRLDENGILRDLSYVDSYEEIDGEKTELWAYNTRANISWLNFEDNGMHLTPSATDYERGSFFAFKLRVPIKGTYDVNIDMEPFVIGTEADVYMFPKGEITTVLPSDFEGKTPIGHIDNTRFDEPVQNAGTFTVDRGGEFYIVFKFDSDNPEFDNAQRHSIQIKNIILAAPAGPFEKVGMNIETLDGAGDELYFNAYRKVEITLCDAFGNPIDGVNTDYIEINDIALTKGDDIAHLAYENGNYYVETGTTAGEAEITLDLTYRGKNVVTTFPFAVADVGKTGRTIYSDEMIEAARENIKKYDWAKSEKASAVRDADRYLEFGIDALWDNVTSQEIPRSVYISFFGDPEYYTCRYCNTNLLTDYGMYPFTVDILKDPWKIKCPECSRRFPSNDFGKFYELGRTPDNEGKFERITALENHRKMLIEKNLMSEEAIAMTSPGEEYSNDWYTYYGYGVKGGYLYNDLYYDQIGTSSGPARYNPATEVPERWGVDDSLGYNTGGHLSNGVKDFHTYIAYYAHHAIFDVKAPYLQMALQKLGKAYLYTGDEKYGNAGAILLDRIADNYPDYDYREMFPKYWSSHGGSAAGKATGRIRESYVAQIFVESYDIFYPAFENPEVIEYLHNKALYYNMENDKATATKIRQNIEDGICRETFKALKTAQISANFGIHQWTAATAAAALDHKKDSAEIIDWLYATSRSNSYSGSTGGDIDSTLVNTVYRDGQNFESPIYNQYTVNDLMNAAVTLNRYKANGGEFDRDNLLEHPKFLAVTNSFRKLTLLRRGTKTVADSGTADLFNHVVGKHTYIDVFNNIKDIEDPEVREEAIKVAQQLNIQLGKNIKDEHYNIWTKNPESLKDDVMDIVEKYGEGEYDKSTIMTGYGIGVLRDGALYDTVGITGIHDSLRDFTLNFSGHMGHQHNDFLDLGMDAYGIGMTTDLGYPEEAVNGDPHSAQWSATSLAHNTVTVNEAQPARPSNTPQEPLHFDAKDTRVKVMDARTPDAYPGTVDEFRRTIVMIDYDDEVSYGVDFFRVDGGKDHAYTFGPNTNSRPEISENLKGKFIKQIDEPQDSWISDRNHYPFSSYAGPKVQFGWDPGTDRNNVAAPLHFPNGYTWMFNVERADNPEVNEFWVDYQIEDFRNISRNPNLDVRLRITMLNDFNVDEITFASSKPQRMGANEVLGDLERLLVRRKGTNLDSLFTTVYEPYKAGERYVTDIKSETLTIDKIAGVETGADTVKAVKVVLDDGRVDYVVYASNKNNTYRITDTETGYGFEFAGFVGVWTVTSSGENVYSYLNDGSVLGEGENKVESAEAVVTGTVTDFQKELSLDNWVDVTFDRDLTAEEAEDLVDRMMNIDRAEPGNSSYVIEGITMTGAKNARIDLDSITPISKYVDDMDFSKGFIYDIEVGKRFEIPMSYEDDGAPVFDPVGEQTVSAGSMLTLKVNAIPSLGNLTVSYRARTLPRGASFDEESGTFSWKPTSTQLGKNLVAIDAVDSVGRISTVYFEVEVFGSTTGGSTSGGGGGGGGGADVPPTVDPEDPTNEPTDEPGTDAPSETKGFTDLGEHAWATDAINALAEAGIIKGTSESTFAPANNITRADYAILLVRAFKLESEETENFADVLDADYFAKELAVARNTGLVGGIGDNKYAPRNTITRQDMMVILHRALVNRGAELKAVEGIDVTSFADYEDVADYAREAVKALVNAGLVNGKGAKLAGNDKTTRAEVAVLLKRVLDYIK